MVQTSNQQLWLASKLLVLEGILIIYPHNFSLFK